jgi:hypothetical protein
VLVSIIWCSSLTSENVRLTAAFTIAGLLRSALLMVEIAWRYSVLYCNFEMLRNTDIVFRKCLLSYHVAWKLHKLFSSISCWRTMPHNLFCYKSRFSVSEVFQAWKLFLWDTCRREFYTHGVSLGRFWHIHQGILAKIDHLFPLHICLSLSRQLYRVE